jgi:pyruvate/2-oxoglutarate dehydrogenase complex dihydrolipoamide dehydrogenase (E3) component
MGDHDAIIIGTGQSGPSLARRLVAAGQKVAVIERKFFGGTCVNTGCTPTKTLVASAYAAFLARRAGDYGVTIRGPVGVDMKAVKARKDAVAGASRRGVERSLKTLEGCTVYEGHAQFVGTKKVAVDGVVLDADRIFINVGGRALIPPIPGLDQVPYLTNSSMMDVDFLPPHLIVLGGSYIGLEFAQVYRRFGIQVTVIELAPLSLPEIKSGRIDGAIRPGSAGRECGQQPEHRAKPAHPCSATSVCAPRCNIFDTI